MATPEEEKAMIEKTLREKEHDKMPNDNEKADVEGNATAAENEADEQKANN